MLHVCACVCLTRESGFLGKLGVLRTDHRHHSLHTMHKNLSLESRQRIFDFVRVNGMPVKVVAELFKVHPITVKRVVMKVAAERITPRVETRGRKPKISVRNLRLITRKFESNEIQTSREAAEILNTLGTETVSSRTVRRTLGSHGYRYYSLRAKPYLSDEVKKKRLEFCRKYQHWTHEWRRVLFSDESSVMKSGNRLRRGTYVKKGEPLPQRAYHGKVRKDKSVMVWGCIGYNGPLNFVFLPDRVTSADYAEIIVEDVVESIHGSGLPIDQVLFQQDNAPIHTARQCRDTFELSGINLFPWPPYSPDLNIIEHVWAHLKRKVEEKKPALVNVDELKQFLHTEFDALKSSDLIKNLYDSLPERINACLKAKGGYTEY